MQLTQFNPTVNRNISQSRVRVSGDPLAYGADASGLTAVNHALAQAGDIAGRVWMRDQNNKVVDAANDYNRQINSLLYDEDNGLYKSMQGANAVGIQDAYTQAEKKIRQDVMQKYGISSEYANKAFLGQIDGSVTSNLETIDKYQREEADKHRNTQINGLMENTQNVIARSPGLFATAMGTFTNTSRALLVGSGMDQDAVDESMRKMENAMAANILDTMSTTGDYKNGLDVAAQLRGMGVDENVIKKYEHSFRNKAITMDTQAEADDYIDKNCNVLKDSKDNAYADFKKKHPIQFGTVAGIETGNQNYDKWDADFRAAQVEYGLSDVDIRWLKAICAQESTFNADATNGDAVGPFQFKSATAAEMGITDRMDPHQAIMAAAKYFKSNKDKLGSDELAILAHNGGPGGTEAARAGGYLDKVQKWYNDLYPGGSGGDAAYEAGKNAFMGTIPQNGPVGCVEAATEISSYYSPFMADEYNRGVVNVDTLVDDAEKKGMVIPYDPGKVEKGDVIVYDTATEKQGHVTIANGSGGYIGNMSSANGGQGGIGESSDINDAGTPVKIIKLGLHAGNSGGPSQEEIAGYEEKQKAAFDAAWARKLQAARDENHRVMLEVQQHIANNPGATPYDTRDYINEVMETHPNLQYDDDALRMKIKADSAVASYEAQLARASAGGSGGGSTGGVGKANAIDVSRVEAEIGESIHDKETLYGVLEGMRKQGINFSPSQIDSLAGKVDDFNAGKGEYAVDIMWTKENVEDGMKVKRGILPDAEYKMAKRECRAWAVQYKTENGNWPAPRDMLDFMVAACTRNQLGGVQYTSQAAEGLAGIDSITRPTALDEYDSYRMVTAQDGRLLKLTPEQTSAYLGENGVPHADEETAKKWDYENRMGG